MALRVLIACHNATAHGGEIMTSLKDKKITYDFMDSGDHRSDFIVQRIDDYGDDMDADEFDAFLEQPPKPEEYDRLEKEYFAKYPDRKQYTNWKDVPSNTYDYVFGMFCPIYSLDTLAKEFGEIRDNALRVLKPGGSFIVPVMDREPGDRALEKEVPELGVVNYEHTRRVELNLQKTETKYPTPKGFVRSEVRLEPGQYDPNFPEFWEVREKAPFSKNGRWDIKYTKQAGGRGRTFRSKALSLNKNGRRSTRKSQNRRHRRA